MTTTSEINVLGHQVPAWADAMAAVALLAFAFLIWCALRRVLRGKKAADTLTVAAAGMASSVAATGMWHFFSRTMHLPVWIQAVLFAFMEISVLASALRARANVARDGEAGADGLAVWVLTSVSGLMSATEAASPQEALVRLGAPLVAAWLWERSMVPERRAQRAVKGTKDGALSQVRRRVRESLLARLGVTAPDQNALEIRQDRALRDAVRWADRLATADGRIFPKLRRRAIGRKLRDAVRLSGPAGDEERTLQLMQELARVQHAEQLAGIKVPSPWTAAVGVLTTASSPVAPEPIPPSPTVNVDDLPRIVAAAVVLVQRSMIAVADVPAPTESSHPQSIESGDVESTESGSTIEAGPTELAAPDPTESDNQVPTKSGNSIAHAPTESTRSGEQESTQSVGADPTESAGPESTESAKAKPTESGSGAPTAVSKANGRPKSGPTPRSEQEMQELTEKARALLAGDTPTAETIRTGLKISAKAARQIRDRLLDVAPTESAQAPTDPGPTGSGATKPTESGSTEPDPTQSGDSTESTDPIQWADSVPSHRPNPVRADPTTFRPRTAALTAA